MTRSMSLTISGVVIIIVSVTVIVIVIVIFWCCYDCLFIGGVSLLLSLLICVLLMY